MGFSNIIKGSPFNLKILAVIEDTVPATGFRYDSGYSERDICEIFNTDERGLANTIQSEATVLGAFPSLGDHLVFYPTIKLHKPLDPQNPPRNWCFSLYVDRQSQIDNGSGSLYYDLTQDLGLTWTRESYIHGLDTTASENWRSYFFGILIVDKVNDRKALMFCSPSLRKPNTGDIYGLSGSETINLTYFEKEGDFDYNIDAYSDDFGPASKPDGYGENGEPALDHTSDTISVPNDPLVSTGSTGFMHVYKVSEGALSTLGQYLFPRFDPATLTDVTAVLRAIAGIFAYQDSIQYVVDLHAVPVNPNTGSNEYIRLGALETDISQPLCSSDYVNFDCGSISIREQYRNFLDYTAIKYKLFLPFYGFVDVNPEYIVDGTLQLKYKFNIIDGSFMAYLISTSSKSELSGSVIAQYAGNACIHLPVVAASYGAIVGGLVSGAMALSGAPTAKSGNIGQVVNGALTADNFQPQMRQSNSYNAGSAFLGCRRPYLLIEREVPCFSERYAVEQGLPLNVSMSLGSVTGFTVVENPILNLTCDDEEREEIYSLLKSGVIF